MIADVVQRVVVTFTTTAHREHLPDLRDTILSIPSATVSSGLEAAKEVVKNKPMIIEKLGKIWLAVKFAESVGETLSDVLHLQIPHLMHLDPHSKDTSSHWWCSICPQLLDAGEARADEACDPILTACY